MTPSIYHQNQGPQHKTTTISRYENQDSRIVQLKLQYDQKQLGGRKISQQIDDSKKDQRSTMAGAGGKDFSVQVTWEDKIQQLAGSGKAQKVAQAGSKV